MNTLPTNWLIEVTEENQKELDRWRQQVATEYRERTLHIGYTLLSKHHRDNSYYFTEGVKEVSDIEDYAEYKPITLEQFRQITNPMNTLPTKWYIQATEENREELNAWRLKNATQNLLRYHFAVGHTLLSEHHSDKSCYYSDDAAAVRDDPNYKNYQEITLEQFRQITNSKPMSKPEVKTIQISRTLLNQYYEAATVQQREYIINHFKLDGTTTDEAIRELHDLACWDWKPKIKANHPECFPEESKYFDFSKHTNLHGYHNIVSSDVAHSLGLCRNFIQVRNSDTKNSDRSFYLTSDYNWELVKDEAVMVLIPTKKVK